MGALEVRGKSDMGRTSRLFAAVLAVLILACALMLSGCGPQTPEATVRNFLKAHDTDNWQLFLNSILPESVRSMTPADETYFRDTYLKEGSQSLLFKPDQLVMKTEYKGDSATVRLTSGKLVAKNPQTKEEVPLDLKTGEYKAKDPQTGKLTVQKLSPEEVKQIEQLTVYKCTHYKGRWYVDFNLEKPAQTL